MLLVDYVVSHWDAILAVATAVHDLAPAVVNLTPTPKDDDALASVYRKIELVAGLVSEKANQ